jgi:hypothetical protein
MILAMVKWREGDASALPCDAAAVVQVNLAAIASVSAVQHAALQLTGAA